SSRQYGNHFETKSQGDSISTWSTPEQESRPAKSAVCSAITSEDSRLVALGRRSISVGARARPCARTLITNALPTGTSARLAHSPDADSAGVRRLRFRVVCELG